jgi:hypothetical protein
VRIEPQEGKRRADDGEAEAGTVGDDGEEDDDDL